MYLTNKQQQQKSERKQQIAQFAIIISFFDFISLIETSERERERKKKPTSYNTNITNLFIKFFQII